MPVLITCNKGWRRFFTMETETMWRTRLLLHWLKPALIFCFLTLPIFSSAYCFEYKDAVEAAEALAQKPFETPKKLPDFLSKIDYDQWRRIRFKPEDSLWREDRLPFEVQFFHPGWLYSRIVDVNVIESGKVKPVPFSRDLFHYGINQFQNKVPADLGFAGFRIHYPINTAKYYDEVVVFLGASYFRAVGSKEHFGLSARGVAIDTAVESGEEFPYFRKFWLVRPPKRAQAMTVFALLDSPSLTGAYQFRINPGNATLVDVTATLFLRKEVNKIGIAPLSSMFFYGENTNIRPTNDFRPEVHDSDGLQIATDTGEWIWRPLIDPKKLLVTSFQLDNPKGFGLLQRDRNFDHYQDLEAEYQTRPSAWIIPGHDWGKGRVELVQIPTDSEKNDNIVAYWISADAPKPGNPISISYQIRWNSAHPPELNLSRVAATRTAFDEEKKIKTYLIDFAGKKLDALAEDAKVQADIGVGGGDVVEQHLQKNDISGGWRLVFQVKKKEGALDLVTPNDDKPLELRAFLRHGDEILTETWSYVDPFF